MLRLRAGLTLGWPTTTQCRQPSLRATPFCACTRCAPHRAASGDDAAGAPGWRDGDGRATAPPRGTEQPGPPRHSHHLRRPTGHMVDVTVAAICWSEIRNMALDNITPGVATKSAVKHKLDQYLAPSETQGRSLPSTTPVTQLPRRAQTWPLDQSSDPRAQIRGHPGV